VERGGPISFHPTFKIGSKTQESLHWKNCGPREGFRAGLDYSESRISTKTRLFEAKIGMVGKMGKKERKKKDKMPQVGFPGGQACSRV
jgi:hypothetical protein